jgi:hypothetical protein
VIGARSVSMSPSSTLRAGDDDGARAIFRALAGARVLLMAPEEAVADDQARLWRPETSLQLSAVFSRADVGDRLIIELAHLNT